MLKWDRKRSSNLEEVLLTAFSSKLFRDVYPKVMSLNFVQLFWFKVREESTHGKAR